MQVDCPSHVGRGPKSHLPCMHWSGQVACEKVHCAPGVPGHDNNATLHVKPCTRSDMDDVCNTTCVHGYVPKDAHGAAFVLYTCDRTGNWKNLGQQLQCVKVQAIVPSCMSGAVSNCDSNMGMNTSTWSAEQRKCFCSVDLDEEEDSCDQKQVKVIEAIWARMKCAPEDVPAQTPNSGKDRPGDRIPPRSKSVLLGVVVTVVAVGGCWLLGSLCTRRQRNNMVKSTMSDFMAEYSLEEGDSIYSSGPGNGQSGGGAELHNQM